MVVRGTRQGQQLALLAHAQAGVTWLDHRAFLSRGVAQIFFQPLEFHLELADFLVELGFLLRRFRHPGRRFGREDFGEPFEHLFLSLAHLHGINLVTCGYRMHRLYAFKHRFGNPNQPRITRIERIKQGTENTTNQRHSPWG